MTLSDRVRSIERKRAGLLTRLASVDPARLDAHPLPGKWSIREIIEHLVLAEVDVAGDLASISCRPALPRRFRQRVAFLIVSCVIRFNIPVKVPTGAMMPAGNRSLAELGQLWETNHQHMAAFVAGLDRAGERRALFRHPIAGPISVAQGIAMLDAHLDRHIRQVERLERLMLARAEASKVRDQ